jgi:hypothetical protein
MQAKRSKTVSFQKEEGSSLYQVPAYFKYNLCLYYTIIFKESNRLKMINLINVYPREQNP